MSNIESSNNKEDKDDEQNSIPSKLLALKLKLIVVIVDWNNVSKVEKVLQDQWVRFQYVSVCRGTANSDILDVLGLGVTDKGFVICLQPDFRVAEIMRIISVKLGLASPGKGIAFTMPLSGAISPASQMFSEEQLNKLIDMLEPEKKERVLYSFSREARERWESHMEAEFDKGNAAAHSIQYDLILTVINQGYSDELMDKAKEAGAGGGTVVSARRIGADTAVKFFGVSVQEEKEIVAILTKRDAKNAIMKAINQSHGLSTESQGIIFSLPVDDVAGLDFM